MRAAVRASERVRQQSEKAAPSNVPVAKLTSMGAAAPGAPAS